MDYMQGKVRLHKTGPMGVEVYDIFVENGAIIVQSGPMGRQQSRLVHTMDEKPRVDRMIEGLKAQGYQPLEQTFGPWAQARAAGAWGAARQGKRVGRTFGSGR